MSLTRKRECGTGKDGECGGNGVGALKGTHTVCRTRQVEWAVCVSRCNSVFLIVVIVLLSTLGTTSALLPWGRLYGNACGDSAHELADLDGVPHSYTYAPAIPTETDSISLLIVDFFPSTAYSLDDPSIFVVNDTVHIALRAAFAGGFGSDIIIPWAFRTCLPPRSSGITTISMEVSREAEAPDGSVAAAWQESFDIAVVRSRGSAPVDLVWTYDNTMSECLGGAATDQMHQLSVVPAVMWTGEPTTLWYSYDADALGVTIGEEVSGCASVLPTIEDTPSLAITCESWLSGAPVANLDVVVRGGFSGWTDIQMDSLRVGATMIRTGNTARLTSIDMAKGLAMDFNRDGVVGFADFFLFADAFGSSIAWFDFNRSGQVDIADFLTFADSFGSSKR